MHKANAVSSVSLYKSSFYHGAESDAKKLKAAKNLQQTKR